MPSDLIRACLEAQDADAWQEFIKRFHRLIAGVVLRTARQYEQVSVQLVDDLVQDTYLKLCADQCRLLRKFDSRHPDAIYGFLKVVAANVTHDYFKSVRAQKRGGANVTTSVDSSELSHRGPAQPSAEQSLERNLLIQQVDACLHAITSGPTSARDRKVFWLYYRTGLSASAIAMLPAIQLSTKGVESTLLRLTKQVRQRLVSPEDRGQGPTVPDEGIHSAESF